MIIYTVSWHEKQIKSCKKQIDIQDYINCIHVDLKKTCLEMQRPTEKQELVKKKKKSIIHSVHPATYQFKVCYILDIATQTERY